MNQVESKKVTPLRQVFTIVERNGKNFWVRIGTAFINKDGSETVYLDALPVNGRMHIRTVESRNGAETGQENED
jgi:hypothetical protein